MPTRRKPSRVPRFLAACATAAVASSLAGATTSYDWAPNPGMPPGYGGSGTWDLTSSNWRNSSSALVPWPNTGTDTATFRSTGGTVTLGADGIKANTLWFQSSGYTVAGGGHTLNLAVDSNGTDHIDVSSGDTATFSAPIQAVVPSSSGNALYFDTGGTVNLTGGAKLDVVFFRTAVNMTGSVFTFGATSQSQSAITDANVTVSGGAVLEGPAVGSNAASLLFDGAATGNSGLTVSGTGSALANLNAINVEQGNHLIIQNGASATVIAGQQPSVALSGALTIQTGATATLGTVNGTPYGSVTVTGAGSTLNATAIGAGTVTVSGGGKVAVTGPTARAENLSAYTMNVTNGSEVDVVGTTALDTIGSALTIANSVLTTGALECVSLNGATINLTDPAGGHGLVINGTLALQIRPGLYEGTIVGTGSVLKTGDISQAFGAANSYSGGTVIQGGTLEAWVANSLGTGAVDLQGGALELYTDTAAPTGGILFHGGTLEFYNYTSQLNFNNVQQLNLGGDPYGPATLAGNITGSYPLTYNGPGVLTLTGSNSYAGPTTVNAGTLVIGNTSSLPSGAAVTINGTSTLQLAKGASVVANLSSLTLSSTGKLDLTDGSLNLSYAAGNDPIATIRSELSTAYNGGKWAGPGITSSVADANHFIAYVDSTDGAPANTIELKLAIPGDVNLDGTVNLNDFLTLVHDFGETNATWSAGDFDYDGVVGLQDLLLLTRHFGGNLTPAMLAGLSPADQAQAESLLAQVPEPTGLTFVLFPTIALLRRRRDPTTAETLTTRRTSL